MSFLISGFVSFVLFVLGLLPSIMVLKGKYVVFVVGLLFVLLGVVLGGADSSPLGGIGVIIWIVAASRLALPFSRWARQLYGPHQLGRARQRRAGVAARVIEERIGTGTPWSAPDPAPGPGRGQAAIPERPRSMTGTILLTAAGILVVAVGGGSFGFLAAGAAWPVLWVVRAGWRRGRTCAAVIGTVAAAWAVFTTALAVSPAALVLLVVGVSLFVAGLVRLHRDPLDGYLRVATR